jgi:hypothetical protein
LKHRRALGLAAATALAACLAAWLTPQSEVQALPSSGSGDDWNVPVVFGVR